MATTKISVSSNLTTIGVLSPYSYQVKPKTNRDPIKVEFDGAECAGRLTAGQGKGKEPHFYAYFTIEGFQHWIQITSETHAELKKNPAARLVLTTKPAEPEAPAAETVPAKGKRAKREQAAA